MFKKVLFLCVIMSSIAFAASVPKDSVEMRIKQFNEYKQLVDSNREKEIARNTPSKEEIEIQLMKEKQEFEKQIAIEREKREQRRDNLVNTVLIGGIGYGGYRIGRHHRWW
ncbi:hypothetical protein [Fusobacterium varium]|uniref:hypothetical protein n=1 Tax=Fusobacterium varium TaxID=856 RepID=UPI000BBB572A|nr:hypothetical protein [uncultured Fusobacterium sp.]BBA51812.1 hypothetical protein FV113G1_21620 [Fusobacterium varium]